MPSLCGHTDPSSPHISTSNICGTRRVPFALKPGLSNKPDLRSRRRRKSAFEQSVASHTPSCSIRSAFAVTRPAQHKQATHLDLSIMQQLSKGGHERFQLSAGELRVEGGVQESPPTQRCCAQLGTVCRAQPGSSNTKSSTSISNAAPETHCVAQTPAASKPAALPSLPLLQSPPCRHSSTLQPPLRPNPLA